MSTLKVVLIQFNPIDQINGMISIQPDNKYQKRWRCTFFNAVSQISIASFKESVTSKLSLMSCSPVITYMEQIIFLEFQESRLRKII